MADTNSKIEREKLVDELNPQLEIFYDLDKENLEDSALYPIQSKILENPDIKELCEIARGGEKFIIKAYDSKADRHIAVARPIDTSQEGNERFLREARITASLEHPNISSVYDISADSDNQAYFTTELLEDKSLQDLVKDFHSGETDYKLEDLLDVLVKVCDAVAYAHSRNVIHLDIKPENIQVGTYGNVLLIDWGLAKILTEKDDIYLNESDLDADTLNTMTLNGTLKGTPGFMAPEQAGFNMKKNKQTDVYALGAVLYYILTGKAHIQGDTLMEVLRNTCLSKVTPIHKATDKELPSSLTAVCEKALSFMQEDRYPDSVSFKAEIQAYLRGFATKAEEAGFSKQLALLYRRKPLICQVIVTAMIVIISGTFIFVRTLSQSEAKAVLEKQNAEKNLELFKVEKRKRDLIESKVDEALNVFVKNLNDDKLVEDKFASLFVGASISNSRALDFENAMLLCDSVLKKYPNNSKALSEKAYLYLIDHKFVAAREAFWACATEAPHVFELGRMSMRYSKLKPDDSVRMDLDTTMRFINELPTGRDWLAMYLLVREKQLSDSISDYSKWVKEFLFLLNKNMKRNELNFSFEQTNAGNKLSLAGSKNLTNLMQLSGYKFPLKSILETLELSFLNLSHTEVKNLVHLREMKLKEINLYDCAVTNMAQLQTLNKEKLRLIIIKKGQIPILDKNVFKGVELRELD
ncbi:MAG: serine/threonine protein kinase [Lentisphaeraceae bacterium]|nr:serine/threonine protein kinase [Lentisphaeraceae bacterium]